MSRKAGEQRLDGGLLQARATKPETNAARRLAAKRGCTVAQLIRSLVREACAAEDALTSLLAEQRETTELLRKLVELAKAEISRQHPELDDEDDEEECDE